MSAADPTQDSVALAERIAAIAADKKAIDIRVIDLRGIVSYTDFFVIASGNTERQAKSIHDAIYEELKHDGDERLLPRRTEGGREARWILLDYWDVRRPHLHAGSPRVLPPREPLGRSTSPLSGLSLSVRSSCEHTFVLSTNRKGAIAETKIVAAATELGVPVLRPMQEHGRYDLAFEIGDRILRVQCKWGALDEDGAVIKVSLRARCLTPAGYIRTPVRARTRSTWWPSIAASWTGATFCRALWPVAGQSAYLRLNAAEKWAARVH